MGQSGLEKWKRDDNRFLRGRTQTTDLAKWRATAKRRVGLPGTALGTSMAGRRTRWKRGCGGRLTVCTGETSAPAKMK